MNCHLQINSAANIHPHVCNVQLVFLYALLYKFMRQLVLGVLGGSAMMALIIFSSLYDARLSLTLTTIVRGFFRLSPAMVRMLIDNGTVRSQEDKCEEVEGVPPVTLPKPEAQ